MELFVLVEQRDRESGAKLLRTGKIPVLSCDDGRKLADAINGTRSNDPNMTRQATIGVRVHIGGKFVDITLEDLARLRELID